MWSISISLVVYAIVAYYASLFLGEFLDKGLVKSLSVFIIASLASWAVSALIDYIFPSQAIHLF